MKKIILFMSAILLATSCSSDDNKSSGSSEMLVTKMTLSGAVNRVYNFVYNSNNSINKIVLTGDISATYNFAYTAQGDIQSLVRTEGISSNTVTFTYDSSGRLSGYTSDGNNTPITYDGTANTYSYGSNGSFSLLDNGDLSSVNGFDFTYMPTSNSAFKNVTSSYIPAGLFVDEWLLYTISKNPIDKVDNGTPAVFSSVFNSGNYPTSTVVSQSGSSLFTVAYTYNH